MPAAFSWLMFIPAIGTDHDLLAIGHSWIVVLFLLAAAWMVKGRIKAARLGLSQADLIPEDRLTLRSGFELYVEFIYGMLHNLLGHHARHYFWLVGSLFIYIFTSNFMGVLPGLLPPTENISNNLAMALVVLIVFVASGIKAHGAGGYFKHFLGPVAWLAPLIFAIEIFSTLVVRPFSLTMRLTGNINGDHLVLSVFSQLLPGISSEILGLGIPMIFLFLGMFVSFIQAFVFSLLTAVYITMATAHE